MTNIIMLARNRHALTEQALRSLARNTPRDAFSFTFVDDDSDPGGPDVYDYVENSTRLYLQCSNHNLGALKNLGVYWSERMFGRGDWLAVLDNDICVIDPNWMKRVGRMIKYMKIIGGCRHPFHGINESIVAENGADHFLITDAVSGYSHFMEWPTWDRFGPYPETGAPGINQSEDYAFCRKAVDAGLLVGYIDPPVLVHTGITNSNGEPAVGAEKFLRVPGVLYQ